ncbi:MAG: hypothetical protein OEZ04_00375 [Nitrospinota bacterium]|nr:hypothetical protein [Nitrospinota bacterium]
MTQYKLPLLVIGVGTMALAAIFFHLPYINGLPGFWVWEWRDSGYFFPAMMMAPSLLLVLGGLWLGNNGTRAAVPLALFAMAMLYSQVMGIYVLANDVAVIKHIVYSRYTTGYFTDAARITDLGAFLENFHLHRLSLHANTHPAGPIIHYYIAISLFGMDAGAYAGAGLIGVVSTAGVFVVYILAGLWTTEARSRLVACGLYATLPGLVVFFPAFDLAYPVISVLMIYLWRRSFDDLRMAAGLGGILFVMMFFAYNLLVMGSFMVMMSAVWIMGAEEKGVAIRRVVVAGAVAVLLWLGLNLALHALTGYDPILAFRSAIEAQKRMLGVVHRPYITALPFNITDFALGAGYMAIALFAIAVWDAIKNRRPALDANTMTIICAAQIAIVDLSGLLPGETARVWLFMQPFVIIPAGLALARFPLPWMVIVFTLQWLIMVALRASMVFRGW